MTDLTEQFNHGLLPDGWYYYKASDGRSDIATEYGLFCIEADNKVKVEVLEKVPSYEEWLEKTKSLKVLAEEYCKEKEENAQLKELLNKIKTQCELLIPKNGLNPVSEKSILCKTFLNLIDEVLK